MGFNIPAGKLKHIITIEEKSLTPDADYGGDRESWTAFKSGVRVEKTPMTGRERLVKQASISEDIARFRGRYISGLDATMRVVSGGKTYQITSEPIDINSDGRWFEIMGKAIGGA